MWRVQLSLLRVTIGGMLLQQGNAAGAVKEFQAALDLVPQDQVHQRGGILHNIGVAFLASNMLQVDSRDECSAAHLLTADGRVIAKACRRP